MSISSVFTDPLFSTIITIYILILLYFPSLCLGIILSPVLISTSLLLLSLLRLGAIQNNNNRIQANNHPIPIPIPIPVHQEKTDESCKKSNGISVPDRDQGRFHGYVDDSFVEWDVGAPLEVIYEGKYEGEGVEENEDEDAFVGCVERYVSLSKFYPETDSNSDLASDSSSEEGEDRDGMIEIELDGNAYNSDIEEEEEEDDDDDNLIEIDLHHHPPASAVGLVSSAG